MTLPKSHHESLQRQLRTHEERVALLRGHLDNAGSKTARGPDRKGRSPERTARNRAVIEREINIHERLMELARDPKVMQALDELAKNPDFAREAARDPKGAARERGIELPANMALRVDAQSDRVHLQITYYEDLFPFTVTWTSDSGFLPPTAPKR